jgi:putative membrane protein
MDKNLKTALIIGGIIVAVLVILSVVPGLIWGGQDNGYGMMGPWMMGGFGWMWLMPIFWILFLGLIIWGIVALVRGTGQPRGPDASSGQPDSALEVLRKRYARGEINKEEYEEKKKDLE